MVQILPQARESLGELLGRGLGSGLSQGAQLAAQFASEGRKRTQRLREKLPSAARAFTKQFAPTLKRKEDYDDLLARAEKYLADASSPDEALSLAYDELKAQGGPKGRQQHPLSPVAKAPLTSHPHGLLGEYLEPAVNTIKSKPSQALKEIPVIGTKLLEDVYGLLSGDPLGQHKIPFVPKGESASRSLGERLRGGLSEEEKQGAERFSDIGTMLAPFAGGLKKLLSPSRLKGLFGRAAPEAAEAAVGAAEAANPVTQELQSLSGRIGGAPEALERRVTRATPESKLFKTAEQQELRNQQLKLYPKYEAEIMADAEKRAARLAREPGPQALATREARMAHFEKEIPQMQANYQRAVSRVRALEDQMAKIPSERRSTAEALLEMSQRELRDAEFALSQTLNNAKTGEARSSLEAMRNAAREKMAAIADEAYAREVSSLKKADYNPEMIKKANALSKKKLPKSTKQDDFYTKVHDEYANEYRNRIRQIDSELSGPETSLGDAMQKLALKRERDALSKMVQSADAENTIHRHNLALREINQRKLASERFAKLAPTTEKGKVGEVARSRMAMQERASEALRSPEAAKQVVGDVVEQAARQNPKLADKIRGEQESISQHIERMRGRIPQQVAEGKSIETLEGGRAFSKRIVRDFRDAIEAIPKGLSAFNKTSMGHDFLISIGAQAVQEFFKDMDWGPLPLGALTAFEERLPGRRRIYRVLFSTIFKKVSNQIKKSKYRNALETKNDEKALHLRDKYPKKLIKEVEEEFISS